MAAPKRSFLKYKFPSCLRSSACFAGDKAPLPPLIFSFCFSFEYIRDDGREKDANVFRRECSEVNEIERGM